MTRNILECGWYSCVQGGGQGAAYRGGIGQRGVRGRGLPACMIAIMRCYFSNIYILYQVLNTIMIIIDFNYMLFI